MSSDEEPEIKPTNGSLSLVGMDLTEIPHEVFEYKDEITTLDLSHNQFREVKNLDKLPKLTTLILDNNEIETLEQSGIENLKDLETLWLNNNNIQDLETQLLPQVENLKKLNYLSLLRNPACPNEFTGNDTEDYKIYRIFVLYRLRYLKFLDAQQVKAKERDEANKRGQFARVAKPDYSKVVEQVFSKDDSEKQDNNENKVGNQTELPDPDKHLAFYGRQRYHYSGKHSEGNRFIVNDDL